MNKLEYRLLSQLNEQFADYAFLVGHNIRPGDIPHRVQDPALPAENAEDQMEMKERRL